MTPVESSSDFLKKVAGALNWKLAPVEASFTVEEDKTGVFLLKLQKKIFLDPADFKLVCRLTKDLGGSGDYFKAERMWKVPSAYAKPHATPDQAAHKEPDAPEPRQTRDPEASKKPEVPYTLLPVDAMLTMPFQRRRRIEGPKFDELVESVKSVGVLEPILARHKGAGSFEVVVGDRRHEAAKKAKLLVIPAIVKQLSDAEAYEVRMIENVQREDLTDLETAEWLDFMIKKFGYTQRALAQKLGKHESWVSHHLSMLATEKLVPGQVSTGEMTEKQARELSAATAEQRDKILEKANETGELPSANEMERIRKAVPCAECGELTSNPVHSKGKFYCSQECREDAEAKAESDSQGSETEDTSKPEMKVRGSRSFDVAEFTCPKCKKTFIITCTPSGKHKFTFVRTEEEKK